MRLLWLLGECFIAVGPSQLSKPCVMSLWTIRSICMLIHLHGEVFYVCRRKDVFLYNRILKHLLIFKLSSSLVNMSGGAA